MKSLHAILILLVAISGWAEANDFDDPHLKTVRHFYGRTIKEGYVFEVPGFISKFQILSRLDQGARGVVYKIKFEDQKVGVLKVALSDDINVLRSLSEEARKLGTLKKLGVEVSNVLFQGSDFAIKEYIEGIRGDEWYRKWVLMGADANDQIYGKLLDLYRGLARQHAYAGDLKAENLFWVDDHWVVVDSGRVKFDLSEEQALQKYYDRMHPRWGVVIRCSSFLEQVKP